MIDVLLQRKKVRDGNHAIMGQLYLTKFNDNNNDDNNHPADDDDDNNKNNYS